MNPDQSVQELVSAGRSRTLEWLPEDSEREVLGRVMAAMANSLGGTLILGVEGNESPSIKGLRDADSAIGKLLTTALSLDPALIIPTPEVRETEGKTVLMAHIPGQTPHVYALDGTYLCREDSNNKPLKPGELRDLLIQRGEIAFEVGVVPGATVDHLDWGKIATYTKHLQGFRDAQPEAIMVQRGCLVRRDDQLYPTYAGLLLFGKDPQQFIYSSDITAVRFGGRTMSDTFDRQDIRGTLPEQIRRAETFLVDHLRKGVALSRTMARDEHYEYPMEAAREIVVNAVAHRDYSIRGDGIRLFIFQDRMEVTSPGRLPGPVTVENIKDERFSRNPLIVQVLSDMGFIERLGYGVDRVLELMDKESLRQPDFEETAGGFRVVLYRREEQVQQAVEVPDVKPEEADLLRGLLQDHPHVPVNPRQERALLHLGAAANTRITNSELQRMFPDVHPETIRRDLADLVTKGILAKMGQKRGSYYVLARDQFAVEQAEDAERADGDTAD